MKLKDILRYVIFSGIFIVPALPFFVSTALFFPFITTKGFIFRIIVEIIFACFIVLAITDRSYRPNKSFILWSLAIFVSVIAVADLFSINVTKSLWSNFERMEGWVLLAHLLAYFLVLISVLKTETVWNYFWNTTLGASLIVSFVGVLQMFSVVAINQGSNRLDAYTGNSTYLAVYLLFHIFLALFLFVRSSGEDKMWRWFYGIVALADTFILYRTATRGAILGFIGGLVVSAILIIFTEKKRRVLRNISIGIFASAIVLGALFLAVKDSSFIANNQVLSRFKPDSLISTAQTRTSVWKIAIEGFKERPILGWGQESFNYVFNKYYEPSLFGEEQWFDRAHNTPLDWLIAGGLLGLITYLSILIALVWGIWKASDFSTTERAVLLGLVSAYFFQSLFVFDNLLSYVMLISVLAYVHYKNHSDRQILERVDTVEVAGDVSYSVLIPTILVLIISLYVVTVRPMIANNTLIRSFLALSLKDGTGPDKGHVLLQKALAYNSPLGKIEIREQAAQVGSEVGGMQNADPKVKQKFFELGKSALEEQIKETSEDIRHYVLLASYLNSFGQFDEAINLLEKAIDLSPKKQLLYFELATSYLNKKDYKKALEIFKFAYDLDPSFASVQRLYALGALYAGDQKLVDELLSKIDRQTIIFDNRFVQAYQTIGNFKEIAKIFEERLVIEPTNYNFHLSLAATYMALGRRNDAVKELEAVIEFAPDDNTKKQAEFYISEIKAGRNP